jgi:hypothetical protein
MTPAQTLLAAAALIALSCAGPAFAASTASSASSESSATSVGSVSTSFGTSSEGSSKTVTAADGDYKIIEVAAAAQRPGTVRVKLQGAAGRGDNAEFFLYLPQAVAEQAGLAQGGVVTARPRPYGTEFAHAAAGAAKQAFYLVLADDWYRELQTRPVQL